jgi:hypothetical protein
MGGKIAFHQSTFDRLEAAAFVESISNGIAIQRSSFAVSSFFATASSWRWASLTSG